MDSLAATVGEQLGRLDPDAIVRLQIKGPCSARAQAMLSAPALRDLAPRTMNISLAFDPSLWRRAQGGNRPDRG